LPAEAGLPFVSGNLKLEVMSNKTNAIARRLRAQSTESEALLWRELRGSRLEGLKFRRQTPVAGYVVDFCCYDLGLTIELDGKHHAEQPRADAERRAAIERHGYLELRFSNADVTERLDWVLHEIRRAAAIARCRTQRPPFPRVD
jgi:very-short-patch-repair endonuclease